MKISFNDVLSDANELVAKDSRFTMGEDNGMAGCCPCVVDVILDGENWFAIICAADGDYYQVALTIGDDDNDGDGDVTGLGAFSEVEQETSWVPVDEAPFLRRMAAAKSPVVRKQILAEFERTVRARSVKSVSSVVA